jgi:hypothetical protein
MPPAWRWGCKASSTVSILPGTTLRRCTGGRTVKKWSGGADQSKVTAGDFDFFGAPTTPPPSGPPGSGTPAAPAVNQFGMPVVPEVNQFGMPVAPTSQFGAPAAAPVRHSQTSAQLAAQKSENTRQILLLGGVIIAVVLAVGGFIMLKAQGQKTATAVSNTVLLPIVKAHQTEEVADLSQAAQAEETYLADNNAYATSMTQLTGFVASPTSKVTVVSATSTTYCLRADDTSTMHAPSMFLSSASGGASTTPCT